VPAQRLCHQGVIIDSTQMRYYAVPEKLIVLQGLLRMVIGDIEHGRLVKARQLALIVGKVISFRCSHGSVVQVLSRAAQHELGKAVYYRGWESDILLPASVAVEFKLLFTALSEFDGQFIPHAGGGKSVELLKIR